MTKSLFLAFFAFISIPVLSMEVDQDELFDRQLEAVRNRKFEQLNLDIRSKRGETLLIKGIRSFWKIKVLKQLIDAGSDVNARDRDGYTALMLAAWSGKRPDLIKLLLSQGADVNAELPRKNDYKLVTTTALMMALDNGNEDIVGILVDAGADMCTQKNDAGVWALQMAVSKGRTEAFKRMIRVAVARDETFLTRNECRQALFGAALLDNVEIVQALLRLGMNPNAQHEEGWTALHAAAQEGSLNVMKALLSAGGDLACGHMKEGDVKPLNVAQMRGRHEMVEFLDGFTQALCFCNIEILRRAASDDIIEYIRTNSLLLNAPCTLNVDSVSGSTPLMRAARRGNFRLCNALLRMGALTHLKDGNDCTAGDIARSMYSESCAELINLYEQKDSLKGRALLKLWLMENDQLQKTIGGMTRTELEAINMPSLIIERVKLRELPK